MKIHWRLFFLVISLVILGASVNPITVVGNIQQPHTCTNLLQDTSFEAYTPNPYWFEYSLNFGTPLCSEADCTSGDIGPHTGSIWAWFGGAELPNEYAKLIQVVTIPEGSATLSFYLAARALAGGDELDQFLVSLDLIQVFQTDATQVTSYATYTLVTVDVSAFADGLEHDLTLEANTNDEAVSFHVDDIILCTEDGLPPNSPAVFIPFALSPPFITESPEFVPMAVPWADTKYTLSWSAVEGADSYVLEEDTEMDFPHPVTVYQGTQASWTASWRPSVTYWYRVRAQNSRGPGPWSFILFVSYQGVYPSADAGIASGSSGTNYGSNGEFSTGYYSPTCPMGAPVATGINRGLISFDTAGVPANLNISKVALSIDLEKICFISSLSGATRTITAYRVSSPWTENGVTWNNAPSTQESHGSVNITLTTSQDVFGRYEIDITSLVRTWLDGSKPNYGLMLRSNSESAGSPAGFTFDTRDGDGDAPYLTITFNAGDTAEVQRQLELQPPGERQCVIIASGEMLCALKVP